jgi:hypothetical protein
MSDDVAAMLDVFRVDAQTGEETKVGEAEMSADGRLGVVEVEPEYDARLRAAVASVNAKAEIAELVPPAASERPFATAARVTKRGDDEFLPALSRYMQKYYGFSLG